MATRLQARDKAPDFEGKDIFGQQVSLYSKRGSLVLLSFYRQIISPPCHFHYRVNQILRHFVKRDGRLKFIAVFEASREQIRSHIYDDCHLPFSIIADPRAEIFRLYKIDLPRWQTFFDLLRAPPKPVTLIQEPSHYKYIQPIIHPSNTTTDVLTKKLPADFLIMADGKIEIVYYGQNESDYLPFSVIEHCLRDAIAT